jgi:hypothetical protein
MRFGRTRPLEAIAHDNFSLTFGDLVLSRRRWIFGGNAAVMQLNALGIHIS